MQFNDVMVSNSITLLVAQMFAWAVWGVSGYYAPNPVKLHNLNDNDTSS